MRVCAWMYLFKNYAVKDWIGFPEVYGMPLRVGKYEPGAYADFHGEIVRFCGAGFVPGKIGGDIDAAPGTVTGLDLRGLRIAVAGGELLVTKVRTASAGKLDATAWAVAANVKPGERFCKFSK